jgi:hypothetical protein
VRSLAEEITEGFVALEKMRSPSDDMVNSPTHYTSGGIETIDFIEAKELDYCLGNCVKYISRAGKKNEKKLEDLNKAMWYLKRAISNLS